MAEVTAVKILSYNLGKPQLWFSPCERTFALGVPKAITDTCTKFNYIVSNLPPEKPPQSLCNADSTFQRFVDEVLRGLNFVYAFIDDILVASSSEAENIQHLRLLFQRLDQYGLSINPSKCTFGVPTLNFFGFQVCSSGIKPLEDRVEATLKFPQPATIIQLRRFLGMLNYYRRFIREAVHILAPLQQYFPLEDITLTCDVSANISRPLIPKDYRKIVFQHLHGLSHTGIAASTKLVTQRFVWPNIRRDIKAWVNSCHPCQRSKIHRHTKAPIGTFALPDARFPQIHVDFIGPFPPSNGQSYYLTVVDRFMRWMEGIPTADMTAETVCRALLSVWISRFGCPAIITTDQGTNFESNLFRERRNLLGTNRIRCCAYHPKAIGLVERLHRHLKSAIKAHENSKWSEIIPIVLLGMHSAVKKDINATCAELV
ncbi:hypothetical protein TNCV_1277011 [Trichonephila clavipes]|nr:hypothetical protein TNCV_1277011 [Trichonephila clavipes]